MLLTNYKHNLSIIMSGFEALSMVCSILQVISFTKEVLALCKDIYDGRPTTDNLMQENTTSIKVLLDEMKKCSNSIPRQTKDGRELHAIAQKCSKAAQELQKEIQQVTKYHRPGDSMRAIIAAYKSKSHKRKVTSLYDLFLQYQKTLETHILVRLSNKTDIIQLQRREDFTNLSDTMKHFLSQLTKGHIEMDYLITRDGIQTRQQLQQSEARIKQSITENHGVVDYEAKRARLLRSLKYETMNSRRTGLKPAHEATYVSIFDSLEVDDEPTSSSGAVWQAFVQWLQSDKRVFWIEGKPGAGKSTLLKFLLQHENTQKGVDKWSPNTLIVSHFFWKPGDVLQKNLKGLLCSLNNQILSSEQYLVDHVLSEFRLAGDKDAIGDWEIAELESVFNSIMIQCKRSVFFLIDGLDEAMETEEIINFLDALIGLRNIKLCISSRGEDIFLQRFSKHDGFRLNDLTEHDMLRFATTELSAPDDRYPSKFLEGLRNLLVFKAEGVFLWLVLALESVKRGLRNNDEQHEIRSRLSKLPSKLEELYADMWGRLGEDKSIYEKEAAGYLSLVLMNQSFYDIYSQTYSAVFDYRLSSFQLMLATNEKMKANIMNKSYPLPVSDISQKCADATKSISIRTSGLLVTEGVHCDKPSSETKRKIRMTTITNLSQLSHYVLGKVDVIHRSLLDFFKETEAGKDIIARNQIHRIDAELATIILCQLRAIEYLRDPTEKNTRENFQRGVPLHYFCWLLGQIFAQDFSWESNTNITLLHAFESLFEAGVLPWDGRPKWYPLPCFEVLLIRYPTFDEFIQSRAEDKGESHATCILRDFMLARALEWTWCWDLLDSEEYILSFGGDINTADVCLYHSPEIIDGFLDLQSYAARPPEFAAYESIISAVIKRLYKHAFTLDDSETDGSPRILHETMRILVTALERAPNLNKRTSFLLSMEHLSGHACQIQFEISDLLTTMASIEKEDEKIISSPNPMDAKYYHAHLIAEVNLKYIVQHFLKVFPSNFLETTSLITRAQQLVGLESSKPHVKARFYVQLSLKHGPNFASMACYRFIKQDIDILADSIFLQPSPDGFAKHSLTVKPIADHLSELEKVDFSALSVLADEKLGVCRLEDVGIRPPS
ncbi:hypothetical protein V8C42DRAFT_364272 [Trichoderma barbatum]